MAHSPISIPAVDQVGLALSPGKQDKSVLVLFSTWKSETSVPKKLNIEQKYGTNVFPNLSDLGCFKALIILFKLYFRDQFYIIFD
jgi:hypothetical protein